MLTVNKNGRSSLSVSIPLTARRKLQELSRGDGLSVGVTVEACINRVHAEAMHLHDTVGPSNGILRVPSVPVALPDDSAVKEMQAAVGKLRKVASIYGKGWRAEERTAIATIASLLDIIERQTDRMLSVLTAATAATEDAR